MEDSQIEYLRVKKPILISITKCNSDLYADLESFGVLSPIDVEIIQAVGVSKGNTTEAKELYNRVEKSEKGYEKLTRAFHKGGQTGPLKILLEGFDTHQISNPFFVCGIVPDVDVFLSKTVLFQGKERKLSDICKKFSRSELETVLQDTLTAAEYWKLFHDDNPCIPIVMLHDTLKKHKPVHYISRSLSAKIQVDLEIFKTTSPDVFVLKGLERIELTKLAGSNRTAVSSNLPHERSIKFIHLVSDDDWEEICRRFPKLPVHQIRYDKDNKIYILERTIGTSQILGPFLKRPTIGGDAAYESESIQDVEDNWSAEEVERSKYLPEKVFLNIVNNARQFGACICDTPGMGKTFLAAHLARTAACIYPERIAAFISLPAFIQNLPRPLPKLNGNPKTAMKIILGYLTPSVLMQTILEKIITTEKIFMELFFDAFDEIFPCDMKWALELLALVAKEMTTTRVYVTSRPHMRNDLEKTLGVISYNMLPFTIPDQLDFLVKLWLSKFPDSDPIKMQCFAAHCLTILNASSTPQERAITGIPLQLMILAEANAKIAAKYSNPTANIAIDDIAVVAHSMYVMYKSFMDQRFVPDDHATRTEIDEISSIKRYHIWKALQKLSPEITNAYSRQYGINENDVSSKHFALGILEETQNGNATSVEFVHQIMAEYLIGEFLAEIIFGISDFSLDAKPNLPGLLFENIFITKITTNFRLGVQNHGLKYPRFLLFSFQYYVVLYFFNSYQIYQQEKKEQPQAATSMSKLVKSFGCVTSPETFYKLLLASVFHNLFHVFSLIIDIFVQAEEEAKIQYREFLVENERIHKLILSACQYSSVSVVEKCFQFTSKYLNYNLVDYFTNLPKNSMTPIHLATENADYYLVEFLLNFLLHSLPQKWDFMGRALLQMCVWNSRFHSREVIEKREQIIKLLVERESMRRDKDNESDVRFVDDKWLRVAPIMTKHTHGRLIKCLIELGADAFVKQKNGGDNILFETDRYTLCNEDDCLLHFLLNTKKYHKLFLERNTLNQTPLQDYFSIGLSPPVEIIKLILEIPGFDMNAVDKEKNSLISSAIFVRGNGAIIKLLVERGADYLGIRNGRGENVLHVAVHYKYVEAVKYFTDLGVDICERDDKGTTPIGMALDWLQKAKRYETERDNIKRREIVQILLQKLCSQQKRFCAII